MQATPTHIANRYHVISKLSQGGMGAIYHAHDRLTQRDLALKRIAHPFHTPSYAPSQVSSPQVSPHDAQTAPETSSYRLDERLALAEEFRTLASLHHPHIINVLDYGFDDQHAPYFTMQLLTDALPLTQYAANVSPEKRGDLFLQLLQALTYLHRRGVLHRDIKPGNVLVTPDGVVRVLDFGLAITEAHARLQSSHAIGTIAYMAPELFGEQPATIQSDLYACGIMAYEIFAAQYPYPQHDIMALITAILHDMPDFSPLDANLVALMERLLAKEAADRFESAEAVMDAFCDCTGIPHPTEDHAIRESYLQASRFVGRENELTQLTSALEAVRTTTSGSAWLVAGESGVGKSRLLDEVRIRAVIEGTPVLRGQAVRDSRQPFELWRDPLRRLLLFTPISDLEASILRAIVPDIERLIGRSVPPAPTLTGEAEQKRLVHTLVDVFERQTTPLVLILEDLHWAEDSLQPLAFVPDIISRAPVLIIASYRDDEDAQLPQRLPPMQHIRLERFDEAQISDLSAAMLGAAGRERHVLDLIRRETEGNAFFMVEIVRALAERAGRLRDVAKIDLPERLFVGGVAAIIRQRLQRIPEWALECLELAAVGGRMLDIDVLAHLSSQFVSQRTLEAVLNVAAGAAVLELRDERWQFAHEKLREALLVELSRDRLTHHNRRLAEAIERVYPDDDMQAAALAEHWSAAGEMQRAAIYAVPTCDRWHVLSRWQQTLALVTRILPHLHQADTQKADLLISTGRAYHFLGQLEPAADYLQQALMMTRAIDYPAGEARALKELADLQWRRGEFLLAQQHYESSLRLYRQLDDSSGVARALNGLGNVLYRMENDAQASELYKQSLQIAQDMQDKWIQSSVFNNLGNVSRRLGDYEAAINYLEDCVALNREMGDVLGEASALNNLGIVYKLQGDFAQAAAYHEQSLQMGRTIGYQAGIASNLDNLALLATQRGDYDLAQRYYTEGLAIRRTMGTPINIAATLMNLAAVLRTQGDNAAALTHLLECIDIRRSMGTRNEFVSVLVDCVAIYIDLDQIDEARTLLLEGLDAARSVRHDTTLASLVVACLHLYLARAQHDRCRRWAYRIAPYADQMDTATRTRFDDLLNALSGVGAVAPDHRPARWRAILNELRADKLR